MPRARQLQIPADKVEVVLAALRQQVMDKIAESNRIADEAKTLAREIDAIERSYRKTKPRKTKSEEPADATA
jgi:meiotically up-regulated gene 157 (Mug157) protein